MPGKETAHGITSPDLTTVKVRFDEVKPRGLQLCTGNFPRRYVKNEKSYSAVPIGSATEALISSS